MRFGLPLPDRIQNAPELNMGLQLFYTGFLELTSTRPTGFGPGPISQLSVLEYCIVNGIDGEQRDDFIWMIARLDEKYLTWSRDRGDK